MNKFHEIPEAEFKRPDRNPELKPLIGLPMRHLSREGTTMQAHFGNLREVDDKGRGISPSGQLMLQVFGPCPWRLTRNGRIYIGSGDFHESPGGDDRNPFEKHEFTRYDMISVFYHREFAIQGPVLESVELDDNEGFTMRFTDRLMLVVFPVETEPSIHPRYWQVCEISFDGD